MKRLILAMTALNAAALAAAEWTLPPEQILFKSEPGAELVKANCLVCHSSEYITTQPALTRAQWQASVAKMQQKYGAPVPPEIIEPLIDYLVRGYGQAAP